MWGSLLGSVVGGLAGAIIGVILTHKLKPLERRRLTQEDHDRQAFLRLEGEASEIYVSYFKMSYEGYNHEVASNIGLWADIQSQQPFNEPKLNIAFNEFVYAVSNNLPTEKDVTVKNVLWDRLADFRSAARQVFGSEERDIIKRKNVT